MAAPPPISVNIYTDPRSLARVEKRLAKWQGKPLEMRLKKATEGAMSLMVGPIRSKAPVGTEDKKGKYPHAAGNLRRKVRMRGIRKRPGEVAAAYAGPSVFYGVFVRQGGAVNRRANDFVAMAYQENKEKVSAFIDYQVRKMA